MKLQREGYVAALTHPDVVQAITRGVLGRIALTYVEWAGNEVRRVLVDWAMVGDRASAEAFAARLAAAPVRSGVSTSISGVIDYVLPMFGDNGYEGTRRVIDISGDGPNNQGPLRRATGPTRPASSSTACRSSTTGRTRSTSPTFPISTCTTRAASSPAAGPSWSWPTTSRRSARRCGAS